MSDNGADERRELLERFLHDLDENRAEVYFDESDLIEIFDYATDVQNYRACLEVLLLAARIYPKSTGLNERLAFYMYDLGSADGIISALKDVPEDSVMRRLLLIQSAEMSVEQACALLDNIVDSVDDFEDEWIIRLVDVAGNYDATDWLKLNYEKIKAKCSYQQTFIYEMLEYSRSSGDYEYARTLAEELTMLEPFNEEFWEILAELRISHLQDYDAGLNDLEYALAINPQNTKALQLKAEAMLSLDKPVEEIMQVVSELQAIEPDNEDTVHLMCVVLSSKGYEMEAIQALEELRKQQPDNMETLTYLVLLTKGNIPVEMLKPMVDKATANDGDYDDIYRTVRRFRDEGEYAAACKLLLAVERYGNDKNPAMYDHLFELYYRSQQYSAAVDFWSEIKVPNMTADVVAVLSALRIGNRQFINDNVESMMDKWTYFDDAEQFPERMGRLGSMYLLKFALKTVRENLDFDFEDCDPFV
ncbi:MAG: hypothetical protein HFJ94_07845 [Muribaculaceae bacterium]|nr:hypothetical protein [Muribaculaceae bacterium]